MALKKSQLYSSLWQSCDELRGGMDASQYKDYVLTLLFMKYVSDKHESDRDALIEVPEGGGFVDMVELKGHKEIGDRINKIIGRLAEANDLKGVIDQADFNDESKLGSGKAMQDRLSKLVGIFEDLDFSANRAGGDDLLGDAYEYLMMHFATESGKSKGQFYTPAEVSRIIAKVVGVGSDTRQDQTIYDPTCGSGSLLLKAVDEAPNGISVYGQEMDNATWSLARMNLILHGQETAEIWRDNTLSDPYFKNANGSLKTHDFAIANPPFSFKSWSTGFDPDHDEFNRFEYGVPPAKNGDYAFLLHLITSLRSRGKGAIILPHGVLFRGHREAEIRRNLIARGLIKGIIGLPANLFYGTGIPACIIVIDKEGAPLRDGVFMIDASRGFIKDGNKNRLREQDIHRIVDVFTEQIEVPRYSRMVPVAEITSGANDCNLNIPRYIDSSEPEDLHDLEAHLRGGIPNRDIDALGEYWSVFPSIREALFEDCGREGYSKARISIQEVEAAIPGHEEFCEFSDRVWSTFNNWREIYRDRLRRIHSGTVPKFLITELSEDILREFTDLPLIDPYDIYQRLMDYWQEAMQDDVYLIVGEGWRDAAKPRGIVEDKRHKLKETPDLIVKRRKYKLDLIPPELVVNRYYAEESTEIESLRTKCDAASRELEGFAEEHTGEDGLLEEALNDKGKPTKASATARLRTIRAEPDGEEERKLLDQCLKLLAAEADATKSVKEAQAVLDALVLERFSYLSESEIKSLVVEDKWLAAIQSAIESELRGIAQRLATRIAQIEERYAQPLPNLKREVETYSRSVEGHLAKMGISS
ncbi:MAG: N-6 DNA methylase [Gammaproteobacteria bacterium]|nr:N-6 DNA methylase [Gammaproteobacteria bacterium]MYH45654.1 N-6 DNA methylase [Gammaproteobacteria bacterium]MYL13288.1 N-6 DNA methylase [Gammaproteobacteria bacterium]